MKDWSAYMDRLCDESLPLPDKIAALRDVADDDITPAMLTACAEYILERAVPLEIADSAIDVCGTGGDSGKGVKTFNISTAAAFVIAAGGIGVVKHGNRAVSSLSGSSDVLAALGVPVAATPEEAEACYDSHNLCFVAAPSFHPVLKSLAQARKELGRPSFFNLLGPLCNPARTTRQVIGVYSARFLPQIAEAARNLGKVDVLAVHSDDGLDEISVAAPTALCRLKDRRIAEEKYTPFPAADLKTLAGGTAAENARIIEDIFRMPSGAKADIICLNAGAGFMVSGVDKTLEAGFDRARVVLAEGLALEKLEDMRVVS
jgi:anthranilate phosphoribosyltransferase